MKAESWNRGTISLLSFLQNKESRLKKEAAVGMK
jgi:hypothetical protein